MGGKWGEKGTRFVEIGPRSNINLDSAFKVRPQKRIDHLDIVFQILETIFILLFYCLSMRNVGHPHDNMKDAS